MKMLPNLIIIGAMKCGTSSLHYYLSLHPQVCMSKMKELDFFLETHNWHRGLNWYQSHFQRKAKIYGESSPNYTCYPRYRSVPIRMHKIVPNAKLIYLVRDPIKRMISQYVHRYAKGAEDRPIEEALMERDFERNFYLQRSSYYLQLEQFFPYYDPSQILVITAENLRDRTSPTLHRIFEFLGVEANFYSQQYEKKLHESSLKRRKNAVGTWLAKTPPVQLLAKLPYKIRFPVENMIYFPFSQAVERLSLSEELKQALREKLAEDINRLQAFTGYQLTNWQK